MLYQDRTRVTLAPVGAESTKVLLAPAGRVGGYQTSDISLQILYLCIIQKNHLLRIQEITVGRSRTEDNGNLTNKQN